MKPARIKPSMPAAKSKARLLNREQLAAQMKPPVNVRTITNWRGLGLPVASKVGRFNLYDLAACQAWADANLQKIQGGYRPSEAETKLEKAGAAIAGTAAAVTDAEIGKLLASIHTPEDILRALRSGKMTPIIARTLNETYKAAKANAELALSTGDLMEVEGARLILGRALQAVRTVLDGAPARVTSAVSSVARLDRQAEAALRMALKDEISRSLVDLAKTRL